MGLAKLLRRLSKGPSGAPARLALEAPPASPQPAPSAPSASQPSSSSAGSLARAQLQADPAVQALVEQVLTAEAQPAAAAAEQLFAALHGSRDLALALCVHRGLLFRLRQLLRQGAINGSGGGASRAGGTSNGSSSSSSAAGDAGSTAHCERLQAYAAYLVSALAGGSAATDARLVDAGLVVPLVSLLGSTRSCSTKKGVLRALSKLLGAPEAVQQVVRCGGITAVAALLDGDDAGVVRRCLDILSRVCSAAQAGAAMAELVGCGGLGSLTRLAECCSAEVQAEAVEVLKLLCRLPETGPLLVDLGGIEALANAAGDGHSQGARTAARVALQRLRETAEGRPEGRPVLLALQAAGWGGSGLHGFSAVPAAAAGVGEMMSADVVRRSVAALACSPPQVQLGEVQMLSRVAASEQGVQLIVTAQGVHALLGCLAQNLGPGGSGPPVGQAVVAAVLGTLGTLCQQDACAAGAVAATLATLAQQPDARSVQLAAALRRALPSREGAPASPFTPPSHKQQQQGGQEVGGSGTTLSPYSVLSPPGTAGSVLSASGPTPPAAPRCGGGSASPPCSTASSGPQHNGPSGQRGESGSSGGGGTPRKSVFVFTSESAVHFLPSHAAPQQGQVQGQRPPRHPGGGQLGLWDAELARQLAACDLGSGGSQLRAGPFPLSQGTSCASAPGPAGACAASSGCSGSTVEAREAQDQFNAEAAPASLLGDSQGWLIQRSDVTICRDEEGREVRLGEGGFGVVFKAMMNGVDEVAVKRVRAEAPSARDLSLFHKEVQVLRSLAHRNIVQYYGACLEPGSLFFVMELMRGGDLYTVLRRHPAAMAWGRLGRKVALDVALGLNHLHSRRPAIMHRDLKSPNVLLSEEGIAKICDVGMARHQVSDLVTAQAVLTPLWAAPEVVRRERASVKADMWSFGILIFEIVTGADIVEHQPLAYTKQVQQGLLHSCPEGGGAKLVELPPDCPPVAAHIFHQCTQLDPALRPNAGQVVEWLRAAATSC